MSKHGVDFIIYNESSATIDSMRISTSDKRSTIKFIDIRAGAEERDFLNMNDVMPTDGNYLIEIYTRGNAITEPVGYYSNGVPINEKFDIYVSDDTVRYEY